MEDQRQESGGPGDPGGRGVAELGLGFRAYRVWSLDSTFLLASPSLELALCDAAAAS